EQQEQRQLQHQEDQLRAGAGEQVAQQRQRPEQAGLLPEDPQDQVQRDQRQEREDDQEEGRAELAAPEPAAPARDRVLVALGLVRAPQAGARDEPVRDDVDQPAEGDDAEEGGQQRPAERPVVDRQEGEQQRRAGQHR